MLYKMHAALVLIVLIGLFASTAYGDGPGPLDIRGGDCTGKLILEPPSKRGDIEGTFEVGTDQVFKIWENLKTDKFRTRRITVQGTCCWDIYNRDGDTQKLVPGQSITPSIAFIWYIWTDTQCTSE